MGFNDDIADVIIFQSVDLLRFEENVRGKIFLMLSDLELDLVQQIQRADLAGYSRDSFRYRRLEALLNQTRNTIGSQFRDINSTMKNELLEIADLQQLGVTSLMNRAFGADIFSAGLSRGALKTLVGETPILGGTQAEWWGKQAMDLQQSFASQMRLGVLAGETNDDMVRRIRGRSTGRRRVITLADGRKRIVHVYSGGIMETSTRNAMAMVRTSSLSIQNQVKKDLYEQNSDLLKGTQALVTLDGRTTLICQSRSGGAWDLEGNPLPESSVGIKFPGYPPWHWQCRTIMIPLTRSWEELAGKKIPGLDEVPHKTRASMDGQVARDLTYEQWLKKKPVAFQREVLGAGRFDLWQKGKLSVHQMVEPSGRVLSLEQIRERLASGTLPDLRKGVPEKAPPPPPPPPPSKPPAKEVPLPDAATKNYPPERAWRNWTDEQKAEFTRLYKEYKRLGDDAPLPQRLAIQDKLRDFHRKWLTIGQKFKLDAAPGTSSINAARLNMTPAQAWKSFSADEKLKFVRYMDELADPTLPLERMSEIRRELNAMSLRYEDIWKLKSVQKYSIEMGIGPEARLAARRAEATQGLLRGQDIRAKIKEWNDLGAVPPKEGSLQDRVNRLYESIERKRNEVLKSNPEVWKATQRYYKNEITWTEWETIKRKHNIQKLIDAAEAPIWAEIESIKAQSMAGVASGTRTMRQAIHDLLELPEDRRLEITLTNKLKDPTRRATMEDSKAWLERVTNRANAADPRTGKIQKKHLFARDIDDHPDPRLREEYKDRSFFQAFDDHVNMGSGARPQVYVHESGHFLEYRLNGLKDWQREAWEYLQKRSKGEPLVSLKELTGGNYQEWEKTWKDKFLRPYMGKYYPDKATEIISMALEYLYADPETLALKDPDMFDWIVDLLRGF
jgi:hypothetical protein